MPSVSRRGLQHSEAYCLMTYRADDGNEEEVIWNSRDGVTPFVISLRSGKTAKHVDWGRDVFAPNHVPAPGTRMFVDLTPERAREHALANAQRYFDMAPPGGAYPDPREQWATPKDMARDLLGEYLRPGAPDLVEVQP